MIHLVAMALPSAVCVIKRRILDGLEDGSPVKHMVANHRRLICPDVHGVLSLFSKFSFLEIT